MKRFCSFIILRNGTTLHKNHLSISVKSADSCGIGLTVNLFQYAWDGVFRFRVDIIGAARTSYNYITY